jgi:hypothetical protein
MLHASVERASCLSARHDWEHKVSAHAELFTMLGDLTGDRDLARLVNSAAGRLQDLMMTVGPVRPPPSASNRTIFLSAVPPSRPGRSTCSGSFPCRRH